MLAVVTLLSTFAAVALGAPGPAPEAPPRTWAVVVGVGELVDPRLAAVPHGPADAERLRDHLVTAGGLPAERVLLVSDGGAAFLDPARPASHVAPTRRNVRLAIAWLSARVAAGDQVVVTWSGQGAVGEGGEPLLVTADAARDDLPGTAIDASWLAQALSALPAAGSTVFLDTSFGGRAAPAFAEAGKPLRRVHFEALVPARVGLWLAAPVDRQAVESGPHGAFSAALLSALREARAPAELWGKLVAALPAGAPRPIKMGTADLGVLVAPRAAARAERPELVLQSPHAGSVSHAEFDPSGRRLATAGRDGVVKLWDLKSFRIVANLDAAGDAAGPVLAWSPDGERLVADTSASVFVWSAAGRLLWSAPQPAADRARGDVMRRFASPLLKVSPDGALLALPSPTGATELRAMDDGRVVARLPKGATSHGPVVWDPTNTRFAVPAKNERDVLVYRRADLHLEGKIAGKTLVANLAFSGDGKTLVVGRLAPDARGGDFPAQVVTLHDVSKRLAPRPTAAPITAHLPLATSADGRWLAAPGLEGVTLVDLAALTTSTLGLTASGEHAGGFVRFARDARTLAVYMADDTRIYTLDGALDRTLAGEAIALAPDLSATLAGSSSNWGDGLALRDVAGRHPPRPLMAEARPIIALWSARSADGQPRLVAQEKDRTIVWDLGAGGPVAEPVPATRDAARLEVVAGDAPLDAVVRDAATHAPITTLRGHRAAVTGVVASPDGKTLVSASHDTTLRVWDAASGRELATITLLAASGADDRWVISTPDGLFDGSPSGQAQMQWRVGDTLFRLEQYAGELYTPGLFARLWAGERPQAGLVVAELAPPPRVRIARPTAGATVSEGQVTVGVRVEDLGGGATPAWLYVNGRRVPATRARPLGGAVEGFEVELVEGDNHLRATAFNRDGTVESAGDEVTVTWAVPEAERPVLHVVAVGVDAYQDPSLRLAFAGADASAIAKAFRPGLYARIDAQLVLDAQATRARILSAIGDVARRAAPRDALFVYLAGHGALVGSTFYYLPWEARAASDDDVAKTGLSQADLAAALVEVPATKQVVVLDACHSGAGALALGRLVGQRDAVGLARAQRRLAKASGVFLVAASTAAQKAGEIKELGHGILTYALLTGLGLDGKPPGATTTADGLVTMNALLAWVDDEVPRLTAKHQGGPQNPVQASTGQDFPIATTAPR